MAKRYVRRGLGQREVSEPDPHWHVPAWSPEQKYLWGAKGCGDLPELW